MVDEVDAPVRASETSGAEATHAPTAHAVGTPREVSFFEGQDGAVSVGPRYSEAYVHGQRVAAVEIQQARIVGVELCVLRIGNIEQRVLSAGVLLETKGGRQPVQQISRSFDVGSECVLPVVVGQSGPNLHDK